METLIGYGQIMSVVLLNVVLAFALYAINLSFKMDSGNRLALIGITISLLFIVGSAALTVGDFQPKKKPVKAFAKKDQLEIVIDLLFEQFSTVTKSRVRL